jgi:hypothetical protein
MDVVSQKGERRWRPIEDRYALLLLGDRPKASNVV